MLWTEEALPCCHCWRAESASSEEGLDFETFLSTFDKVLLFCQGWSVVVQSQLTAASPQSNPPNSAFQVAGMIGVCYHTWP